MTRRSSIQSKKTKQKHGYVYFVIIASIASLTTAMILTSIVNNKAADLSTAIVSPPSASATPSASQPLLQDDYLVTAAKESAAKNVDVIGWIRIEGTSVDYPVVQAKDNDYYLTHDVDKTNSKYGSIFLDYRCDPISLKGNNILYGHHMKDGSMFASLIQYKNKEFFKNHSTIEFATLEKTYQWEIFSVFITDPSYYYLETKFIDDEKYLDFINNVQAKSIYKMDITLTESDNILVLSTCTYEYNDARFVIAARMKD